MGGAVGGTKQIGNPNLNAFSRLTGNQQVAIGAPLGGIDIPPANLDDPFGGRIGELVRSGFIDPGERASVNWGANLNPGFFGALFGNVPPAGSPGAPQGPTLDPTFFDQQGFPFAVPNQPGGWNMAGYLPPGQELAWGSNAGHGGVK